MRLAVFTSQFPGRINTFFARDMRALLDTGIEVDVFPLYPLDRQLWAAVPDCLHAKVLPRDRVHHLDLRRALPAVAGTALSASADLASISGSALPFGAAPLAKSVYAVMKASAWAARSGRRFDHVLAYWGNYAATAAYVFHRLTHSDVPFSMFLHAGTDLYRDQVFLRQKLQYADNIVLVCEFNRSFLKSLYPDLASEIDSKVRIHHLPLDLTEYSFEPGPRHPHQVLAVGSLERTKGFDVLLRAAALVSDGGLELELRLIGDGTARASLVALAAGLGLTNRVTFSGWQSPGEVRLAMTQATLLAHSPVGLGDAVPTVIKEALAVGTPVVATAVAGIPELLDEGRCGVLVPPGNPELLAQGIRRVFESSALRQQCARAGRRQAERMFDIGLNGPQLASLLRTSIRTAKPVAERPSAAPSAAIQ